MNLAAWNTPLAEDLVSGLTAGLGPSAWVVERHEPKECFELLFRGVVDVALLPSLDVLTKTDVLDVLPGAALSTWSNPYANMVLHEGIESIKTIGYHPSNKQDALLARIILREHYGKEPLFQPLEGIPHQSPQPGDQNAHLIVGKEWSQTSPEEVVLNLGQEWYELVNYPMVWGLFVTVKDEAIPAMVQGLKQAATYAEEFREKDLQNDTLTPELHQFYQEGERFRLDDLAIASLTEFRQYLFYYNITDDIPDFPLYEVPDEGYEEDEPTPLL